MFGFSFPSLKLETEGSSDREKSLENDDLLPVPLEQRTWGFWTFTIFWFSAVGTVANWLGGASFLTFGLTVWDGILCQFFGFLLVGLMMAINGRAGAVYHISYPVFCRASFGIHGSKYPAFIRALSACLWQGVNTVTGGAGVYILLHSIFPSIARIHNTMPKSSALDSANMIGFFVFWVITGAVCFMSVPKWPILIKLKLVAYFISSMAMLGMALNASGGVGNTLTAPAKVHGSDRVWLIVRFTLLAAASCATFVSNAADWQRNATKRTDPLLGQILGFPLSNFMTTLISLIVAASSQRVSKDGSIIWNPLTYLDLILTENYDAKHRAGAFFISLGFTYSSLFSCVFENIYPGGNDLSALLPQYISVRRGFALVMIISVALNPWYLLGSAGIFVSFIASYQIFLFSITGILLVDYYIIQKGRIDLKWLYTADRRGPYWYTYGINFRAVVAYLCGMAVNFAGFLDNMGVKGFSVGVKRSFYFAFITTLVTAAVVYYILNLIFPQASYVANKELKFQEATPEEVEQFAAGKWIKDRDGEDTPSARRSGGDIEDVEEKGVEGVSVAVLGAR